MMKTSMQDWFAGMISLLVIAGFFGVYALSYFHPMTDNQNVQGLTGSLTVAFGLVIQYWVGSSRSSSVKDQTIGQLASVQPSLLAAPAPNGGSALHTAPDAHAS